MSTQTNVPPPEEMGPQAAAAHVLAVDAVPDDGGPSIGGPPPFNAYAEWHKAVMTAVGIGTDILAPTLPFWKTGDEERRMLADAWAPMLAEWFPNAFPQWLCAAGATLVVFGPRLVMTNAVMREEERRAKEGTSSSASEPRQATTSNQGNHARERGTAYPDRPNPEPSP